MTRQQKWAKHAFEKVLDQKGKSTESKYATHCMKAPSLLRQAGLVQAVAFLRTRGAEGERLVEDLAEGLEMKNGRELQAKAQDTALPAYMKLSSEVVGLATWFRRFAQAELKREND